MRVAKVQSGLTLIEILIGIVLASLVVLVAGSGFAFVTRGWYGQQARLEAQQNLRAAVERVVRELRLAGACLPQIGEVEPLLPIQGEDRGDRDALVFRTNRNCAKTTLRATYRGSGPIQLDSVDGFTVGSQAFIWDPNRRTGVYFRILSVDVPNRSVSPAPETPVSGCYAGPDTPCDPDRGQPEQPASLFALEVQRYEVQERAGIPDLLLQVNPDLPGAPQDVLARGIERFNVRYVLQRGYDPSRCVMPYARGSPDPATWLCVRDQPDPGEWALVRGVLLEIGARSLRPVAGVGGDGFYRIRQGDFAAAPIVVRPRNVLHHGD
jgi:type II secretory pathway pseudopilin PulG